MIKKCVIKEVACTGANLFHVEHMRFFIDAVFASSVINVWLNV